MSAPGFVTSIVDRQSAIVDQSPIREGMKQEPSHDLTSEGTSTERARHSAASGMSPAIERVVAQWSGLLRNAARRYGLPAHETDELTQDLRIRVWRAFDRGGENPTGVTSSYVYQSVMSAAVDLLRRRRSGRASMAVSLDVVSESLAAPDRSTTDDEAELAAALERALATLPASRRVAVRLHLDGKHRDEIARVLGWSEAKTRNLLYRGLDDLRRALTGAAND